MIENGDTLVVLLHISVFLKLFLIFSQLQASATQPVTTAPRYSCGRGAMLGERLGRQILQHWPCHDVAVTYVYAIIYVGTSTSRPPKLVIAGITENADSQRSLMSLR